MPCRVVLQTLRILLQAEGPNAVWFRPREAVVRRVLRKEEDGVYVVLFSSTDNALTRVQHEGERVCAAYLELPSLSMWGRAPPAVVVQV